MIPITHQGLHTPALGQRGASEAAPDLAGFLAVLSAPQDSTSTSDAALDSDPTLSAEACLAAGLVVPALPILNPQPPVATQAESVSPQAAEIVSPPPTATSLPANGAQPAEQHLALPQITPSQAKTAVAVAYAIRSEPALPSVDGAAQAAAGPDIGVTTVEPTAPPAAPNTASHAIGTDMPLKSARQAPEVAAVAGQIGMPPDATNIQEQDAIDAAVPKARVSPAESAWQTRLQHAAPVAIRADPLPAPVEPTTDAGEATAQNSLPSAASVVLDTNIIAQKRPSQPISPLLARQIPADDAHTDTGTNPLPLGNLSAGQSPEDQQSGMLTSAPRTPDITETPISDAAMPAHFAPTQPDPTIPQPVGDLARSQINLASSQPTPPYHPAPAPPLATAIPAQLRPHHAAAKAGGVAVLLQPEELGHVRFQIQQHGETVRILLSAERPETLDLLRRHSDQLLQEFRQSGFSQAALDFGQWGQQQRSAPQALEPTVPFDADSADPVPIPRPPASVAAAPTGQGLNLRL